MSITSSTYAHIPGYAEHTKAEKRISEEIIRNRKTTSDTPTSSEDFADAALSGSDFPEEPHFDNERIRSERLNGALRGDMLKDAAKTIQRRKQDLLREHADDGLDYLRGELAALMEEVRETHKILANVRTAEHVLAADDPAVLAAWRGTGKLVSLYAEIRGLQHTLTAPGLGNGQSFKISAVGHIKNSLELSDYWLSKRERSTSHRAANDQLEGVRNFDAWLGAGGHAPFKHSTSAIPQEDWSGAKANAWDYLVWLATKAEAWVPTTAQVVAAYDAANLAVAQTDYMKYAAQEAGRDDFFEVTGAQPLVPYTNSATGKSEVRRMRRPTWGEAGARTMGLYRL